MISQDEMPTAEQVLAKVLSEDNVVWQEGEQKIYVLPEEAVAELEHTLPGGGTAEITRVWRKPALKTGTKQDAMLTDMAARLQAMTDAGAAPPAALASKAEPRTITRDVVCEYDGEIQVLPNGAAVDEFLRSMAGTEAKDYSKTRRWHRAADTTKQEALLADIVTRLEAIAVRLERLENLLIPIRAIFK